MYDNEYPNGTGTPGQEEESDRPGKYYPIYDAVNDYNNYGGNPFGSHDHERKPRKEKSGFGKKLAAAVCFTILIPSDSDGTASKISG